MDKFCDYITNPDWWTIALTTINTIAVIVIAIVQIRIQQQQVKFQKYESYKDLLKLIKDIHFQSSTILFCIHRFLYSKFYNNSYASNLHPLYMDICSLDTEFQKHKDDLRLKAKLTDNQILGYTILLLEMNIIVSTIKDYIDRGIIEVSEVQYDDKYHDDDTYIQIILDNTKESEREKLQQQFNRFKKTKQEIHSYNIVQSLENHCSY